jgi:hypothetical protein
VSEEGKTTGREKENEIEEVGNKKKKTQKRREKKMKISRDPTSLHKIEMTSQLEDSSHFKSDRREVPQTHMGLVTGHRRSSEPAYTYSATENKYPKNITAQLVVKI